MEAAAKFCVRCEAPIATDAPRYFRAVLVKNAEPRIFEYFDELCFRVTMPREHAALNR